jgi:hypothetical protein
MSQDIVLLHDNGGPHTAYITINTIGQLNSEVLGYPACSPELDPSDFNPFEPLKNADDDEMKEAVYESFVINQKLFFTLVPRSLMIAGLHVSKGKDIILTSNVLLMSVK